MDALSDILGALDLRGTLYFTTEFTSPWGVRVPPFAGVARFHLVTRGTCWVAASDGEAQPIQLSTGDLVLVPHGRGHDLTSEPGAVCLTVEQVVERSGFDGRGALVHGGVDEADSDVGRPSEGSASPTRLVCGHFAFDDRADHPFIAQLPPLLIVRHDDRGASTQLELAEIFRLITREARTNRPGADAIVRRLSEVLFIQAVRVWAERQEPTTGLVAALLDPRLGASLDVFHRAPGRPWTLDELARAGGLSRTIFAERFRDLVGLTPMRYVALWRMHQARILLGDRHMSLDAVAQQVGYDSTAAFCRAFKQQVGTAPGKYRRALAPR